MIFKNKLEQLSLIENSSVENLTTNIFHDSFLKKIEEINIKDYKDPDSRVLDFTDKEIDSALKTKEKFLLELTANKEYRSAIKKFLGDQKFYIKYSVIRITLSNENKVERFMKTNVYNKEENKLLGVHMVCINDNLQMRLYSRVSEGNDYSNFSEISHNYEKELLYKSNENKYIGITSNIQNKLLIYFQMSFIKED